MSRLAPDLIHDYDYELHQRHIFNDYPLCTVYYNFPFPVLFYWRERRGGGGGGPSVLKKT